MKKKGLLLATCLFLVACGGSSEFSPTEDAGMQLAKEVAPHIWGADMLRTDRLEEISFTVEAAADEQFIVQRLEREKRCGTVQQLDAEHYCFSAAVYDARELLPWIRTFIGRITAFSCSNEEIERIFYDDLEQTAAYYLQEVQADGEK